MADALRSVLRGVLWLLREGAPAGEDPCATGQLDFSQACQSGQLVTAGF